MTMTGTVAIIQARLGIPDALRQDLRHADEIVGRVRVREDAPCIGRSLRDLLLPSETGMWLMAIRRGDEWVFDPDADTVLSEGDVLLFHGPEDGVDLIREVALRRVLVTTIVNTINNDQVGPIIKFLADNIDKVVAVSFQPVSFTGRDEDIDGLQLNDGLGGRLRRVGSAYKIGGNAAGADGNGKDHNACGIHTLHFPHYAATLPPP